MKNLKLPQKCCSLFLSATLVLSAIPAYAAETEATDELGLRLSYEKNIYDVNDTAVVTASAISSAVSEVYYTLDGKDPTETSSKAAISSEGIKISSPGADGGIVTVKVAATLDSVSETVSLPLSFYRTTLGDDDAVSLTDGADNTYYFSDAQTAFAAVDDPNIVGDVTLKVVGTDVTYTVASGTSSATVQMFSGATGAVTLDLNGKALKLRMDIETVYAYVTMAVNASTFTILDSTFTGTATDTSGKENTDEDTALNAGLLTLENALFSVSQKENITMKNVKINICGSYPRQAVKGTNTAFEIENVYITRDVISGDAFALLEFAGANGSVSDSVIKNARGSGIATGGEVLLTNNTVIVSSATTTHYPLSVSSDGIATVKGGVYRNTNSTNTNSNSAIRCAARATALLQSGVFYGNLYANGNTAKIILYSGYHKGRMTTSGTGYAAAENCVGQVISGGEYDGYTLYTPRVLHESTVLVQDLTGTDFAAATVIASVDGVARPNLTDVYEGEDVTYTLSILPNYAITNIEYTPSDAAKQDIDLTDESKFSVSGDGLIATYKMTVPDGDYTLTFILTEQKEAEAPPVAQIGNADYRSLSAAIAYLKDNDVLKLLSDTAYNVPLEFNKNGIVIDLNGHTLAMDVPDQKNADGAIPVDNTYSILLSGGNLTVQDSSSDHQSGVLSFGAHAGIRLAGSGATFTLQSGTLRSESTLANMCTVRCAAENGIININGGLIDGRIWMNAVGSKLNFTGGKLETNYASLGITVGNETSEVNITGGEIHSGPNPDVTSLAIINI
ncbi:MAG: hypothetical protein LBB57_01675, partial [Clostridiales Family XIII bacterium]|nr:hypothetical protein [Clostridiales Family XIII bacterium]